MDPLLFLPVFAALAYTCGSFLYKAASRAGYGMTRLYFVQSQLTLILFLPLFALNPRVGEGSFLWPVIAGIGFFFGWLAALIAIRVGDVSLQAPLMGVKVTLVALLAWIANTQTIGRELWASAALTSVAVFVLGFPLGRNPRAIGPTLGFVLLSCSSFAVSDVVIGHFAPGFGFLPFLVVMMAVNSLCTLVLPLTFRGPLRPPTGPIRVWIAGGTGLMAIQVLCLTYYMASTGQAAEANILFSLRGLFAVALGGLAARYLPVPEEKLNRARILQRGFGAVLMTLAVALAFA